jgi:hypothetical protein
MISRSVIRCGGVAMFLMYTCLVHAIPAKAEPIKNPQNCKGGVPDGAFHCLNKPGQWVECNGSGDYMCCAPNAQGGKDCEQIESFQTPKNPKANIGAVHGGQLQVAPTNPPPRTTPVPKAGMNAPIMRRGVEGDHSGEPTSESGAGQDKSTDQQGK